VIDEIELVLSEAAALNLRREVKELFEYYQRVEFDRTYDYIPPEKMLELCNKAYASVVDHGETLDSILDI